MGLYFAFALMIIASSAWIIWFVYRPIKQSNIDLTDSNVAIGKQKLVELEQDLAQDLINQAQFNQAKDEISTTLAIELQQTQKTPHNPMNKTTVSISIFLLLLLISIGIYQYLTPKNNLTTAPKTPLTLEQRAEKITQYLKTNQNDDKAWKTLGQVYFELDKPDLSIRAYERAYQLEPDNPRLLVEYASVLINENNGHFSEKSIALIKQARKLDPNSPDALYLSGALAQSLKNFERAEILWNRVLASLPENSPDRAALVNLLAQLKTIRSNKDNTRTTENTLNVKVVLSDKLLKTRSNEDYLIIYLKPVRGRPMPIAIKKIKLKDFTGEVVLGDKDSVVPSNKLSNHKNVLAVARISTSGLALRQAGDVETTSEVITVTDNPSIILKLE